MKVRNYEKKELIIFIIIIIFIIEIIGGGVLSRYKVYKYKTLTGVIINKNIISLIIDKKDKLLLNSNKKLYLEDKLLKYEIIEDKGFILKKNNKKYYEVLIKIKTPRNKKSNDYLELSIKDKKISLYKLLKNIREGDN